MPFVTISSFSTASPPTPPESSKKRRREDEAVDITFGKDGGGSAAALGSGGGGGLFGGNAKGGDADKGETKPTVRLDLPLTEPNERGSAEFNYGELVQSTQVRRGVSHGAVTEDCLCTGGTSTHTRVKVKNICLNTYYTYHFKLVKSSSSTCSKMYS